jgi:hypothetical protein
MGMRKRLFGWCPRPVNPMTLALRRYSVPIVAGAIATVLLVSFFLLSSGALLRTSANALIEGQKPSQTVTLNPPAPSPTIQPTEAPTSTPKNSPSLTDDQVLDIAMACINQYAAENNRTITVVNKTFLGSHGDQHRPAWLVIAQFEKVEWPANATSFKDVDHRHWIIAYQVMIYADNGEIDWQQEFSIY